MAYVSGSTTTGVVSVIGVKGKNGMGGGIPISGALVLKRVSAGTSGVSGSVTMSTVDSLSGSGGIVVLLEISAVSITGGPTTVSFGSGDNIMVPLEEPEGGAVVEEGVLEEAWWWVVLRVARLREPERRMWVVLLEDPEGGALVK